MDRGFRRALSVETRTTCGWIRSGRLLPVLVLTLSFFLLLAPAGCGLLLSGCGHCRALHDPFQKASRALLSTVRLGTVDATAEQSLAAQFKIGGYPTILVFPPGKKTPASIRKYEGARDADAMVAHARALLNMRAIKKVDGGHERFPDNVVAFFAGGPRSHFAAAALPSLLVLMHAHAPSDELKALSQTFEHRLNFGVAGRGDKAVQRLFRARSTPAYLACAPARVTRTNTTGAVECALYDHAAPASKGGGSSVPSISNFLVAFIQAVTGDADMAAARAKYGLRRFVLDANLAAKHAADAGADPAGAPVAAASSALPPLVSSVADFHLRCTDTLSGACVLIFGEPAAWLSSSSLGAGTATAAAAAAATASAALVALLSDIDSWNAQHATRKSQLLSVLLVSSSSPVAATLSDAYDAPLDSSIGGLTMVALMPKRNRHLTFVQRAPFDVPAAMEWLETVVRDDRKLRPSKQANMQQRLRHMLATGGDAQFQSTFMVADSAAATTAPLHHEL